MINGKVTIVGGNFPDGNDCITLYIEDLTNRRLVEMHVGVADFLKALTGTGYMPCDFITRAVYPEKSVWLNTKDNPPPEDKPVLFKSIAGSVHLAYWYGAEGEFATRGGVFLLAEEMESWTHIPTD